MSKTYKGYELIKAIADGEIKENTSLLFTSTLASSAKIEVEVKKHSEGLILYDKETKKILPTSWLFNSTIELIEDEDEIDIQNIKKLCESEDATYGKDVRTIAIENRFVINKLIQAVKQLDKKINK